ncbi:hypothetical protein AGLY_008748, partial [Aphis glycines]
MVHTAPNVHSFANLNPNTTLVSLKERKETDKFELDLHFSCVLTIFVDTFHRRSSSMITNFLMGKWVPFCCTLGGGVDLGLGITYEELCITFSIILIGPKKILSTLQKKFFRKIKNVTTIKTTHKEPCIKFSKLFGHPKIFYRHFKKNFSKKSKISVIPLTLTFGENFNYAVHRHKKKKKTTTHIIVKSIHSSLCSESKTDIIKSY